MPPSPNDEARESVSRRDFLRVGGISAVGLTVAERSALAKWKSGERRHCIFVLMTGGPSQLETFDPKPTAPAEVRGPFKAISTAVPGVTFSETLPELAARADRLAVLRSLHHDAAPIHETGLQLLQTGRLQRRERPIAGYGSVVSQTFGSRGRIPAFVVLPRLLAGTGVNTDRGQSVGGLDPVHAPVTVADDFDEAEIEMSSSLSELSSIGDEPEAVRRDYGSHRFGRLLLKARQLVECGVRAVTVNLFDTLAAGPTWDAHGHGNAAKSTLYDYRDELCPAFDRALAALLDDLRDRGLLANTTVVAVGEFGRTPRLNAHGGRDHWTGAWSGLVAGGGVPGGVVVGATDRTASTVVDRPIRPGELLANVYTGLGIDPTSSITLADGSEARVCDDEPLPELQG